MSAGVSYGQAGRFLKIDSPLGADVLLLTQVMGVDKISTPFLFEIEFATYAPDAMVSTLLASNVTLWLGCYQNGDGRPVNGIIRKLSGPVQNLRGCYIWRAELVPQLAFLTYAADCRIFQNLSVVEIIQAVLNSHNLLHYEVRGLMQDYPPLEYCVQYRETALNFVSRLMEEVGLYYWHEHADRVHLLVISDNFHAAPAAAPATLVLTDQDQNASVKFLRSDFSFRPGMWTLKDYNFEAPAAPLQYTSPTIIRNPAMASYEIYDYPGRFTDATLGTELSRVRIEHEESKYLRLHGSGTVTTFDTGYTATIAMPTPEGHEETEYLLVAVTHRASDMSYITNNAPPPSYENDFVVSPTTYAFRPDRVSRKPFVQGPQTAAITGPAGEQIYTDPYGRVKVRFHWDRNPQQDPDEDSSCWLRVSQFWASGIGGAIQIPRIGEEVIVDFLEGDPDRPIVTGRVYNGANPVIYPMPANMTQAGIKTHSIPAAGFNELRFEDKSGVEQIFIHAQKDFDRVVLNNETAQIGGNETRQVTGNLTESVTGNVAETITGNQTNKITGSLTEQVKGNEERQVTGNHDEQVQGNMDLKVTGNQSRSVTGNDSKMVTGNFAAMVSGNFMTNVGGMYMLTAPSIMFSTPSMMTSTPASSVSAIGAAINMFGSQLEMNGAKLEVTGASLAVLGVKFEAVGIDIGSVSFKVTSGHFVFKPGESF